MPLKDFQVHTNAPVDIDGEGRIVSSDASLTSVSRADGKVDWYETSYLAENASTPDQEQADPSGPTSEPVSEASSDPAPADSPVAPAPSTDPAPQPVSAPENGSRQES